MRGCRRSPQGQRSRQHRHLHRTKQEERSQRGPDAQVRQRKSEYINNEGQDAAWRGVAVGAGPAGKEQQGQRSREQSQERKAQGIDARRSQQRHAAEQRVGGKAEQRERR
ncbi:hypothetical protein [Haliangium sp. UPWRP_2]|uniref:hypothetical protein n=1 Tax=Haliangium sp. UPWRP_2 TaxID=1931276 RepID=UPI0018ED5941|nr:hypothetical protein [Haliangium sp. UPWRP_2]